MKLTKTDKIFIDLVAFKIAYMLTHHCKNLVDIKDYDTFDKFSCLSRDQIGRASCRERV